MSGGGGGEDGVPMVYAASWWSADTFERFMSDSASPMWTNLRAGASLVLGYSFPY